MKKFEAVKADRSNESWEILTSRQTELYGRSDDVRNEFARDYTRILHCLAYRRLKHKTQVFYNIGNDHICTRMEHVAHVESVSSTIAGALGLNTELTKAIAIGHDLGHAPFGHKCEIMIRNLSLEHLGKSFWHEQNGLRFVDKLELLEDEQMNFRNLDLTYAVRDGIISHCGEVNKNRLFPRTDYIDLDDFRNPGEYEACTWEGCVVKLADKIAYVGRDIEDAKRLHLLDESDYKTLEAFARHFKSDAVNTTVIINQLVSDICKNSSPENGICLSEEYAQYLNEIKRFNYERIYDNPRLKHFEEYASLVINSIFNELLAAYDEKELFASLRLREKDYPMLFSDFSSWLKKYVSEDILPDEVKAEAKRYLNEKIYGRLDDEKLFIQAIIDYISGMTDSYAIKIYNELITF